MITSCMLSKFVYSVSVLITEHTSCHFSGQFFCDMALLNRAEAAGPDD